LKETLAASEKAIRRQKYF